MQQLSVTDLAAWLADGSREQPQVLDVREEQEWAICRIEGSQLMPMNTVPSRLQDLDPERPLVCVCHHGGRSMQVAIFLERNGFPDIYNLSGGVDAWALEVDPKMARY
ncbi:MAG: sulfurtransferase [Methyloversatilis sp.]|jgi:rhodanese-related sulfurtransferase|uniref:Rhodanese-related sulfurtransferase n=2 Tax=Pseudomonadota TaxID=1224 RepID=F5RG71_METUF|nr:rhodanese-like domain-containing protein [Methyloversatilis universalis]EGK70559.1 Putative rhodanese-related sulfurtransferase [Methyloversatilis universalis FAM5]MCP4638233.1 sulfurtransferase [Methyloversatilis sp.]